MFLYQCNEVCQIFQRQNISYNLKMIILHQIQVNIIYLYMLKRNKVQPTSNYLDQFFNKNKEQVTNNVIRQQLHSPPANLHRLQRKNKQQPLKASSLTSKLNRKMKQEFSQTGLLKQKNAKDRDQGYLLNKDYYAINSQEVAANKFQNLKSPVNSAHNKQENAQEQGQFHSYASNSAKNIFYQYLVKDKREQQSISTELSKQQDYRMIDFKDGGKQVKFASVITNENKFNKKQNNARSPSILKNSHKNILNRSIITSKSKERERSSSATSGRERRQKQKSSNENNTNKNIKLKYNGIINKLQSEYLGKNVRVNRFSAACYNTQKQNKNQNIPKYKDEIFPPLYSSLFIKKPKQKKGEQIFWMRIPEIFPNRELIIYKSLNLNSEIFKTQESYASDYIITAFNCLASTPKLLQKFFEDQQFNAYGIYIVKIYQQNVWKYIIIDDFIPVIKNKEGKVIPAFLNVNSKADGPLQIWPFLLQKAYANYYARYEALQHGNALDFIEQISGSASFQIKIKEQTKKSIVIIKQKNLGKLKKQLKSGQTIALGQLFEGKIYIPLVYSILNETLYMSDPCKNYKRKPISFENLIQLCKTVYLIHPFKFQYCQTTMIRKVRPKALPQKTDGYHIIQHPSIRCFKVQQAGDISISIKQRQKRLYYFKEELNQYIWIRAILIQKQYGDNGFRWIDGQYSQRKSIVFTHFLEPGQYWILIEPEWRSSSPNELYLQIFSKCEYEITRQVYNQKDKVIQSACLDLSQRYGQLNQINKFICSYNYVTQKVGLIIENIINERVNGDVTVMRSIRGLKCKVQILPINRQFYQCVNINGQQLYKINEEIQLDIAKGHHFTVVLKLKGGMDKKFFKSFDFGC